MKINSLSFGSITIDGEKFDKDVIIDHGTVKKRKKGESKQYRDRFGHTPLSAGENIPWDCKRLIIGMGHSSGLPVMKEVFEMAKHKGVKVVTMSTPEAAGHVNDEGTNLVLHLTC